jgi:TolB-like protein/DNA-binding SARP family transcriptional activator
MLRIYLLGGCRVTLSDGSDGTPRAKKTRAVLAFLALTPDAAATRERVAGLVWSDRLEEQARGSLRQAITELRALFRDGDAGALHIDRDVMRVNLDQVWIDAREVERMADGPLEEKRRIPELYRGDLLADLSAIGGAFQDWLYGERAWRREQAFGGMASAMRELIALRDLPAAEAIARHMLALEPSHEEAHRGLMEAFARGGDKAAALRQFQVCVDALKRTLDAKPGQPTIQLYERIRADRLDVPLADAPVLPVGATPMAAEAVQAAAAGPAGLDTRLETLPVAVLPFRNVGGDPEQDYLGEGFAEDIVSGLSRFKWLSVIPGASSGAFRGQDIDPREVGRRVGVRYAIEGTVRRQGGVVRIGVRLVDCEDARALWTDQRTVEFSRLFDVQDEIVRGVVGQLNPKILQAEIDRVRRRPPDNANAYDCLLRAVPLIYQASSTAFRTAGEFLDRALRLDPDYGHAHAWMAFWHLMGIGQGWLTDRARSATAAEQHARAAIERDPDDPMGLSFAGHVEAFLRRNYDLAEHLHERSLSVNPNFGWGWALSALVACYRGRPHDALERMERYRTLSPFDNFRYFWETVTVISLTLSGRYQDAVVAAQPILREHPNFTAVYVPVIVSLAYLGRSEEAHNLARQLLSLQPGFSIKMYAETSPLERPEDRERYIVGLRMAGLPEQ